ncbi:uncharacterized protein LOC121371386 isoform X1 [Gigantopelta aegis]|uniref:uncharacterized protein LOC121371386 isoform X1 n=1 Tax=Gigantopelta aegis TaxID=1735272 RepID=UPI001B88830C|nr:uncharacterized protein LOC121371386 isoform X1 [Gigantopelta aegis]XP_041353171.1 uncharacterized protein LOC121371386 isoform X1 [Gigantopelta aegis]XP_041353172.1 uncharacterized protein LOC121371386 isoform X1 [Gigantopelta aegis]XP_041353173.1 uncharacterized protein LOC121371386 isoform X1 [Gigantopelta aegis]XP_041353174.1 uncharacterized protein LOC121371386 isoform X1 [Gigantopelta aegis]
MEASRMRPPPSNEVCGNFYPYPAEELKKARSQLIDELYFSPGGGRLMYRIRERTGILPNRHGIFIDSSNYCEQSTELLSKSFPESRTLTKCKQTTPVSKTVDLKNFQLDGKAEEIPISQGSEKNVGLFTTCKQKTVVSKTLNVKGFHLDGKAETISGSRPNEQATGSGTVLAKRQNSTERVNLNDLNVKKRRVEESSVDGVIQIDSDLSCDGFLGSESKPEKRETINAFKCDFCDYISKNRNVAQDHLVSKIHYSASKCKCLLNNGQLTPQLILQEKSLVNEAALFSSVIAMCSFCHCIFKDIYACAKHCSNIHLKERIYYLGVVRKRQTVDVCRPAKCVECDQCTTSKQLTRHLKTHDAVDKSYERPRPRDIVWCICSVCKCYLNNILSCKSHMLAHLTKMSNKTARFDLLFITKPTTEHQILPLKFKKKKKKKNGDEEKKERSCSKEKTRQNLVLKKILNGDWFLFYTNKL